MEKQMEEMIREFGIILEEDMATVEDLEETEEVREWQRHLTSSWSTESN